MYGSGEPKRESCPLFDDELVERSDHSLSGVISCCKCDRSFHLGCSDVQEGWAGHWNLECKHTGLDCVSLNVRPRTKAIIKKSDGRPFLILSLPKKRTNQSILRWVVLEPFSIY